MVHYQIIHCTLCQGTDLQKNGKSLEGTQRWYSKECKKYFRLEYLYHACKPGVKDRITDMTLNGSGVRDIGRVLEISNHTVCSVLKKTLNVNPYFITMMNFPDSRIWMSRFVFVRERMSFGVLP